MSERPNNFLGILIAKISNVEKDSVERYQLLSATLALLLGVSIIKLIHSSSSSSLSSSSSSSLAHELSSEPEMKQQQSQPSPHSCHSPELPSPSSSPYLLHLFTLLFSLIFISIMKDLLVILHKEITLYSHLKHQFQLSGDNNPTTDDSTEFDTVDYVMYRVDIYWSQDRRFKSFVLLSVIVILIFIGGFFWNVFVGDHLTESFWISWTFLADPGTHATHTGLVQRIISFVMTIGGMIVFAFVIGIISEDLSEFVDKLREGKSRVIVTNHTLILGQGEMLLPIIQQIALANESLGGGSIVVLSSVPKITLEKLIEAENMNLYGSDVIVRTGLPHLQADLRNVSASAARAVVILADKTSTDPDVNTVRIVLSLRGLGAPTNGHIVAEIHRSDNEQLVRIVGQEAVETFVTHDIVSRMLVHCARERGLAQVFENLLGFEGCEFYVQEWPDLVGLTFGEVLYRFADAVVIGIVPSARDHASGESSSIPLLNPPNDLVLQSGDRVIVIAEDDDTYQSSAVPLFSDLDQEALFLSSSSIDQPFKKTVENILIVGWKDPMIGILHEFNASACPGSEVTIFSPLPLDFRLEMLKPTVSTLENISVFNIQGNAISRRDLERLPLETYDSILILACGTANRDILQTDSYSLATLLLIRDIQSKRNLRTRGRSNRTIFDENYIPPSPQLLRLDSDFSEEDILYSPAKTPIATGASAAPKKGSVISEITNSSTKPLMAVASVTDYVPSTELVSRALSMIAEQREVNSILKQLLSSEGNEIYLVPISCYIRRHAEVSFFQLVALANKRKHLLIGYKNDERIVLNPERKSRQKKWSTKTELIIIARGLYGIVMGSGYGQEGED